MLHKLGLGRYADFLSFQKALHSPRLINVVGCEMTVGDVRYRCNPRSRDGVPESGAVGGSSKLGGRLGLWTIRICDKREQGKAATAKQRA